jgi:hypothetical protein
MLWAQIGPLGSLTDIPDVAPVQVSTERSTSELVTLGGRRYVQSAPRAPRSWSVNCTYLTPAQAAFLVGCAQGTMVGALYLLTSDGAVANLLPPHLAAPGSGGDTSLGPVSTSPASVTVTGQGPMRAAASAVAAGSWSQTVPVRPSVALALSCWAAAGSSIASATSVLEWRTVDAAGTQLATGNVTATSTATTVRATATFTPGATAAGVQVRTAATTGRAITALRLTEGTPSDTLWVPGAGGAQIVVDDPAQTLSLIRSGVVLSDYSLTLREVG